MSEFAPSDHERAALRPELDPDPVRAFLGCLMGCRTAQAARDLVAGLRPSHAGAGIRGLVFELILDVVAAGSVPDPRVLLAEAQRRGQLDTEQKHQQFALWLFDTHRTAAAPEAGPALRLGFLEGAYRRRCREHAQRLCDAADHAGIETLHQVAELAPDVVDLWRLLADELAAWGRDTTPHAPVRPATQHWSAA